MSGFAFRGLLLDISNALTTEEVRDLKFACSDFIPAGKSENIKRAHELFSELERMNLLGENNRDFLASIFVRINRTDLRNKLLGIRETPRAPPLLAGPTENSLGTVIVKEPLIQDIAEDVSTSWKAVGRKLGVKETVIDNIDDENRRVVDKATKVLMRWKTTSENGATVAALMTALKRAGRTDLAETVRDKVYRQGVSARTANEHQDTQPVLARLANENHDTQNTAVVVPSQPFPNMAELNPSRFVAPQVQPRPPTVDGPAPRVTRVQQEVQQRQPSERTHDQHNSSQQADQQPADQRPAVTQVVEEQVSEDAAANLNEQPNNVCPTDGTQMPVQVQDSKLGLHLGTFGNFLNPAKYIVVERIGQGGYAKVYLCIDKETDSEYAVKLVDLGYNDANTKKQAEALREEIKILQELKNPYIVRYCHTEDEHNTLAVFMEYMKGGSIQKRLGDRGPMPPRLIRKCTWQILNGLQYLHDNGYIHRDIKGANVLLDENDNAKLADFGISKKMQNLVTCTGGIRTKASVIGSTYWTSPELLQAKPYHRNTDCWSVGCTVIEMLTARHPLPELDLPQAMLRIIQHGIAPPDSCNSVTYGFLVKCLTVDANNRPSATELLEDPFPSLNPPED